MKIKRFILGLLESNGYIIYQKDNAGCFIVDPGAKPDQFIRWMAEHSLECKGILLTHHHRDHVGGVQKIRNTLGCPVFIHREDLDQFKEPATAIEDGTVFDLEGETILTVHTPGHTMGSVCFYSEKSKLAFTGDTIFNVDLGRTDLADGDQALMERSIRTIVDKWSNEITIHPGHGDPCTMKKVREINREFLDIVKQ